jgi:hypothetical protein
MDDIYDHYKREEPEPVSERDPDYTDAGHLRELPELLDNITLEDLRALYEDGEYEYPWD